MSVLKFTAIMLLLAGCFASCGINEEMVKTDDQLIIGRWQLEKVCDAQRTQTGALFEECLNHFGLIYEFKVHNVLTVSKVIGSTEDEHRGHKPGDYFYRIPPSMSPRVTPPPYPFVIDGAHYAHYSSTLSCGRLVLRRSPHELYPELSEIDIYDSPCPVYYFIKID
jgi:hypothetical protein